ncbi:cytochrome P450 [Xylaria arbuscula]|nr:cytochrome P450 [Xylaria arbuscula]
MALPASTNSVLAYTLSLFISSLLIYVSYLVLLHPLRKFPGPLVAKVTDWFAGFYSLKKNLHVEILQTHQKYGSVVRLAPNRLVFNTLEAFQDIYTNDRVSKSYTYGSSARNNNDNVFTTRNKDVHRAKRKLIAPALNERAVKSFEPLLIEQVDVYLRQILAASKNSEPVNMSEKAGYLALDIVTQLSFGRSLNVQTSDENRFVLKALTFGLFRGNVWYHVYYLSRLWADSLLDWVFYDSREKYSRLLHKMIQDRVARGANGKRDFYAFITEGTEANDKSRENMWWEAHFLVVAGSDTISTAVSATFFYLSRNPECYKALAKEIRSTFNSADEIKGGPQLASCRYLRACIDEALRMAPPVPGSLWRSQDPNDHQPLVIDGHVIPKGTLFGVSAYALHHNEAYFPDSFSYKPERWLEPRHTGKRSAHDAFAAFSTGSRGCAGKPMAYLESSLIVAKTLWYFDFDAAPGALANVGATNGSGEQAGEFRLEDIFTTRHDGPYLVFRPRGELWKELV